LSLSTTQFLYQVAGSPSIAGENEGLCRTCGARDAGIDFRAWVKDSFTNHDLLRDGSIVCRACLFCFEEKSTILQIKTAREKPQKMRTYSHFVVAGEWYALTKADKRKMRELLASNPTVAVISESGQKHLLFRARVGWWQFEEAAILPDWPKVESLLGPIEELLTGFSKAEIESGDYNLYKVDKFGVMRWHELAQSLACVRLSPYFQLALFLAQKEDI
jgi:hypothetical protein